MDVGPEATCCGHCYGLIGKFDYSKIILIKDRSFVGYMPGPDAESRHEVFRVNKISIINLKLDSKIVDSDMESLISELDLDPCPIHHQHAFNLSSQQQASTKDSSRSDPHNNDLMHVQKTWKHIKSATSHVHEKSTQIMNRAAGSVAAAATCSTSGSGSNHQANLDPKEKMEKRLMDEVIKMFDDTASFYYSPTADLTNSIQRMSLLETDSRKSNTSSVFISPASIRREQK